MNHTELHTPCAHDHLNELVTAVDQFRPCVDVADSWGTRLAAVLDSGGRLLAAGNGGSAAQAQHLTAELVGRYCLDRDPFSAIALHAETSAVTAILNDYGVEELFARQVRAHGRPGDVCLLMSTSGRSSNIVAAAHAARERGLAVWAMTGAAPNPLAEFADDALCVNALDTATVQEIHLVALHLVCEEFDAALGVSSSPQAVAGGAG
jgi:D-sedoheptulose 7-phosphate isomerase